MLTKFGKGYIFLRNIVTKGDYDNYCVYFRGLDLTTGEEIESYMNRWNRPIPIYQMNQAEPLNGFEYEGREVEGLVAFTTTYSGKGKLCYNIEGVQIDSLEVRDENPFLKMNPFRIYNGEEPIKPIEHSDEEDCIDSYPETTELNELDAFDEPEPEA